MEAKIHLVAFSKYISVYFLRQSPGKMSLQNELPPSREKENAGYESSNESEDLSASFENTADIEIGPSLQKEKPVDINDTNFILMV